MDEKNQLQAKHPWWAIGVTPTAVHNGQRWLFQSEIFEMGKDTYTVLHSRPVRNHPEIVEVCDGNAVGNG